MNQTAVTALIGDVAAIAHGTSPPSPATGQGSSPPAAPTNASTPSTLSSAPPLSLTPTCTLTSSSFKAAATTSDNHSANNHNSYKTTTYTPPSPPTNTQIPSSANKHRNSRSCPAGLNNRSDSPE